jgi:hypothetical protein
MPMPAWVSRRFESLFDNAAFAVIVIVAVSVGSAFGLKKLIDPESAAVVGLFIAACMAIIWNQMAQIVSRHAQRRRERLTPSDIEKQIIDWLLSFQYTVQRQPLAGCDFRLVAADPRPIPMPVTIAKLSANPWVTLASTINFEVDRRKVVTARAPFLKNEIAVALNQLGLEYELTFDGDELTLVNVVRSLPFTAVTSELDVLNALRAVRGGAGVAAAMYTRVWEEAQLKQINPGKRNV